MLTGALLLIGEYITSVLFNLCWLLVCFQVQCEVLVIAYKFLNSLVPEYQKDNLLPKCSCPSFEIIEVGCVTFFTMAIYFFTFFLVLAESVCV